MAIGVNSASLSVGDSETEACDTFSLAMIKRQVRAWSDSSSRPRLCENAYTVLKSALLRKICQRLGRSADLKFA